MKQAICAIFLFIILLTPVYNAAVWLNYELKKDYIVANFCKNKSKPELHCEGTCHVKKSLIKQDVPTTSQEQIPVSPNMSRLMLFFDEVENPNNLIEESNLFFERVKLFHETEKYDRIFHPPIA